MNEFSTVTLCSVVTHLDQYTTLVKNNSFLHGCSFYPYDNSQENWPVSARYNDFIDNHLPQDGWIIFCHQDFEFLQDPREVLKNLDKNCIYGPVGVAAKKHKNLSLIFHSWRKPSLKWGTELRPMYYGQVKQGPAGQEKIIGLKLKKPQPVDTVDCCCFMLHSSLIRAKQLRFDEQFDFHLYSEDFSLAARQKGVQTQAVQIDCRHYSPGHTDKKFWDKYHALIQKYPQEIFLTTCVGDYKAFLRAALPKSYWEIAHCEEK